ncbi:methyltransferase family protein [Gallaecimonas mangrovi]|uniref:methyltransferase family protein n=1 Tax=Gallaecimonas mangrovi TaxID=2291597 RepID=UPI000E2026B3|nr:methyltransferase [Gallaecimonas mangrovi]
MPLDNEYRWFLATFFTVVAVFYTVLILWRQRRSGALVHMGARGSGHWWNHLTFRVFRLLIWWLCVLRLPFPGLDGYLGIYQGQWPAALAMAGAVMMVLGFATAIVANFTLAGAWRSGVDVLTQGSLVRHGLYGFSRNPAFMGVALAQLGFVLVLPSAFTLLCLLVGWQALWRQMRIEEAFLGSHFAGTYQQYCQQVRRWV